MPDILKKIDFPKSVIPLMLGFAAVVLFYIPGMDELMQFDRELIISGEFWRLLTGHFTHCSSSHLLWDVAVFIILGIIYNQLKSKYFIIFIIACGLAVSVTVWLTEPNLYFYRGLSGIDSGLFCWIILLLIENASRDHNHCLTISAGLMLCGIIGKTIFEYIYSASLFADSSTFIQVPSAHLAGIGFAIIAFSFRKIFRKVRWEYFSATIKIKNVNNSNN